MRARLPKEKEDFFMQQLEEVCKNSRMLGSHKYMQHGNTSVFRHSVSVAYYSYYLALKMHAPVNETALIRGALLHDYFLYDWHERDDSHKWHGFHHAKKALDNAMEDFELNEVEQDMIRCHMFPLNLRPPKYMESWILCYADKVCSGVETAVGFKRIPQEFYSSGMKKVFGK